MTKNTCLLLFSLFFTAGCYYDVEEELYPSTECSTDNLTYTEDILPILSNNCYTCHSQSANFGNVTLEGYTNLKTYVDNGKLVGVINHAPGFPQMPQNQPQLPECLIQKIEQWIVDGAPNN